MNKNRVKGNRHWKWNGGRMRNGDYILLFMPDHHRAGKKGYVPEHIVIAEKALGRHLPEQAEIHHANTIKWDNRNENLVICESHSYHKLLHRRLCAWQATGSTTARKCTICKEWSMAGDASYDIRSRNHYACRARYERMRRNKALQHMEGKEP